MKTHLLYRDRDFDFSREPAAQDRHLLQDLALETLVAVMADGDEWQGGIVRKVLLASETDVQAIRYRQAVLADCIANEGVVREMLVLAQEAMEKERRNFLGRTLFRHPDTVLHRSVEVLHMFMETLGRLRATAERQVPAFHSEGFRSLFASLSRELDDEYMRTVKRHLKHLGRREGFLVSARLGEGNKGTDYVLRKAPAPRGSWLSRLLGPRPPAYSHQLHPRDENGARALGELRSRGINQVANALAQSADHVLGYFDGLRTELAFYIGCVNLHTRLAALGVPACFPEPATAGERLCHASGLHDASLALHLQHAVVDNDVAADGKTLVLVTGANQGGKSTFLRAMGIAHVMMQCGMFVPARSFRASVCDGIFTHYKREEDSAMESGKFDEELRRMRDIVDHVRPGSLLLCNESLAATNEREGSEIARQIVSALLESGVKVLYVTHLYHFAHELHCRKLPEALFLRAERTRSFKIKEGPPRQTSHGEDLYREVFGADAAA